MLTVHHLGISQSDRIVWLCEELGLEYHLKHYERDPQTRLAPADYRALTPFGTAPVLTDGELTLSESGAIVEYIAHAYANGRLFVKPGSPGYTDFLFWWHFANGSLMPAAMVDMVAGVLGGGDNPIIASLRDRLDRAYAMAEAQLARSTWVAGDSFSAADILTVFPFTTMRAFVPRDLEPYPAIRAYLKRVAGRPAFQRAMAKADPGFSPPLD